MHASDCSTCRMYIKRDLIRRHALKPSALQTPWLRSPRVPQAPIASTKFEQIKSGVLASTRRALSERGSLREGSKAKGPDLAEQKGELAELQIGRRNRLQQSRSMYAAMQPCCGRVDVGHCHCHEHIQIARWQRQSLRSG